MNLSFVFCQNDTDAENSMAEFMAKVSFTRIFKQIKPDVCMHNPNIMKLYVGWMVMNSMNTKTVLTV